jgi:hypothetical protein
MNDKPIEQAKTQQEFYDELRNGVIEEVAVAIEKLTGFGQDTINSTSISNRHRDTLQPRHDTAGLLCGKGYARHDG